MTRACIWIASARAETLVVAICPVLLGAALAALYAPLSVPLLALTLLFSMAMQLGTNWANDYFDYVRGCDTSARKAPLSALQTGAIAPRAMRTASLASHGAALLFALPLLDRVGLAYSPLLIAALLSSWYYCGGKHPLGYAGFGEILVFAFFGPVATCGTALVQLGYIPYAALLLSLVPGALSTAILVVNNLRDIDEDRRANKKTLVLRFGPRFGRAEYLVLILLPYLVPCFFDKSLFLTYLTLPLWIAPLKQNNLHIALIQTARNLTLVTLAFFGIIIYQVFI